MKKFFREFKEFAMRGSVIDLAVGVIVGGAFQKIVNSFVADIVSPILGLFAKKNFDGLSLNAMGVSIQYGSFITEVINFIIMAFVVFVMVKTLNKLASLHTKDSEAETERKRKRKCPYCMSDIDIHATRCPHCTSVLDEEEKEK